MNSLLAEVVVVKDLSRDRQFVKNTLAEDDNVTPGGTRGTATAAPMLPFQLPIVSEDFSEAESLLKEESVRQQMVIYLTD